MALSVVSDPDNHAAHRIIIACEVCGVEVGDREIAALGGLLEMGWLRRFNTETRHNEYFCPKDKPAA